MKLKTMEQHKSTPCLTKVLVKIPVFKSDNKGRRLCSKAFWFPTALTKIMTNLFSGYPGWNHLHFEMKHLDMFFTPHSIRVGSLSHLSVLGRSENDINTALAAKRPYSSPPLSAVHQFQEKGSTNSAEHELGPSQGYSPAPSTILDSILGKVLIQFEGNRPIDELARIPAAFASQTQWPNPITLNCKL